MKAQHLKAAVSAVFVLITVTVAWASVTVGTVTQSGPVTTTGTLTANGVVGGDKVVFFGATNEILLKDGFHAKAGSVLTAKIGDYTTLDATTDADSDSQADWWELAHFGHTANHQATDSDGDGVPDFLEALYGSGPNNPTERPQGVMHYEYDELGRITKIYRF